MNEKGKPLILNAAAASLLLGLALAVGSVIYLHALDVPAGGGTSYLPNFARLASFFKMIIAVCVLMSGVVTFSIAVAVLLRPDPMLTRTALLAILSGGLTTFGLIAVVYLLQHRWSDSTSWVMTLSGVIAFTLLTLLCLVAILAGQCSKSACLGCEYRSACDSSIPPSDESVM